MKRVLSSFLTIYLKILLPGLFLINGVVMAFVIYFRSTDSTPLGLSIAVFTGSLLFAGFISLVTYKYKKVVLVGDRLQISDFRHDISIPISEIVDVTERRLRGHPVTIYLRTPSAFGSKITFLAKSRSIVGELKKLAGLGCKVRT